MPGAVSCLEVGSEGVRRPGGLPTLGHNALRGPNVKRSRFAWPTHPESGRLICAVWICPRDSLAGFPFACPSVDVGISGDSKSGTTENRCVLRVSL